MGYPLIFVLNYFFEEKVDDNMTGKGILSLINKLQAEGSNNDKNIEKIKYIELTALKASDNKQN